jgi:hypothetical protein
MTTPHAALLRSERTPLHSVRAPQDDIPAQHWQGGPLDCATCQYTHLRAMPERAGCEPGYACMQDVYARRIDRFFRWHPEQCDAQLAHPYFEVRAIAARFANTFRLTPLLSDADETVRLQVALRVPIAQLHTLIRDPHREVRLRVAMRIDAQGLQAMRCDADYGVREQVAQRLPAALLSTMVNDSDRAVRMRVAQRMDMPALLLMADDREPEVRRIVAQRLPPALLERLSCDEDWRVRVEVAQRAPVATLLAMQDDTEADIRHIVQCRLAAPFPTTASAVDTATDTTPSGEQHG